jgi:hypothetical protein
MEMKSVLPGSIVARVNIKHDKYAKLTILVQHKSIVKNVSVRLCSVGFHSWTQGYKESILYCPKGS